MLIKNDVYNFVTKTFHINGRNLFSKFINSINGMMVDKTHKMNLNSSKYIEKEFNLALNYFGIDNSEKIHFKQIKEKYAIYIDNGELNKETTEVHYKILQNQYDDYLKSK